MARLRVIRSRLTGTLATGLPLESGWSSPHRVRMGYRRPQASRLGESLSVNRPVRGPLSCVPVPTDGDPRPQFRLGIPGPKGFRPSRGKPSNRPPRYHTHTKTTKHEAQQLSASGKESGAYELHPSRQPLPPVFSLTPHVQDWDWKQVPPCQPRPLPNCDHFLPMRRIGDAHAEPTGPRTPLMQPWHGYKPCPNQACGET